MTTCFDDWQDRPRLEDRSPCWFSLARLAVLPVATADEAYAKRRIKEISDYLAGQDVLSVAYVSTLEIVTDDAQNLLLRHPG
jgi:hypothetical protein